MQERETARCPTWLTRIIQIARESVKICGPPALAAAAAGMAAIGTMASGLSSAANYRYQAKVADANVKITNQQTLDAIQRGTIDRQQLDRKYADLQGQQQATMAANGIELAFGSAGQVASDTATVRNEDASALYRNQANEIRGHDINASNYRGEAQAKRQQARGAIVSAAFGAAATALGGASQYSSLKASYGKGPSAYGIKGSDGIY